jgi:type II secretory pathway component PulF
MNYDEFAFFNQQLALMLREGIPLEGALKQLAQGMRVGSLRSEIEQLGADLSRGTPLKEALARRDLPPLYIRLLEVGVQSNDLPGILILVADHYHRANALWTRLKGLLLYPLIVIVVSLGLTVILSLVFGRFFVEFSNQVGTVPALAFVRLWVPPVFIALVALVFMVSLSRRDLRSRLRWRLPAFREASLAQLASAMALMLQKGTTLPEALALAEGLEANTAAGRTLAQWRSQLQSGNGKPAQWSALSFPPLFLWLIQSAGENVAHGFQKAADIYQARAAYKTDLALYGALPISILLLGQMIFWQVVPLIRALTQVMNTLGGN